MRGRFSDSRTAWLAAGLVLGLGVSYFWPHEPAYANTDRSSQFAMCTGPVGGFIGLTNPIDGVFTLDFLTGDLKGAVLNLQSGLFTSYYYRNIVQDFGLDPKTEPRYSIVTGNAQLQGRGGVTFASGVVYVAELNSGRVIVYGFPYKDTPGPKPPLPFQPISQFQFRAPIEKE
jgi:hypothetical protein